MKWLFFFSLVALLISCYSKREIQKEKLLGTWRSLDRDNYPDIDVYNSFRFNMLLADSTEKADSIGWKYKVKGRYFYVYAPTFLASKNEILTLTKDSFIFTRPHDLDTFRYVRGR